MSKRCRKFGFGSLDVKTDVSHRYRNWRSYGPSNKLCTRYSLHRAGWTAEAARGSINQTQDRCKDWIFVSGSIENMLAHGEIVYEFIFCSITLKLNNATMPDVWGVVTMVCGRVRCRAVGLQLKVAVDVFLNAFCDSFSVSNSCAFCFFGATTSKNQFWTIDIPSLVQALRPI